VRPRGHRDARSTANASPRFAPRLLLTLTRGRLTIISSKRRARTFSINDPAPPLPPPPPLLVRARRSRAAAAVAASRCIGFRNRKTSPLAGSIEPATASTRAESEDQLRATIASQRNSAKADKRACRAKRNGILTGFQRDRSQTSEELARARLVFHWHFRWHNRALPAADTCRQQRTIRKASGGGSSAARRASLNNASASVQFSGKSARNDRVSRAFDRRGERARAGSSYFIVENVIGDE